MIPRCDRVLGPYLKRKPVESAHNAMRIAVYEICAEGAAAHGVVNSAVSLMRASEATTRLAGLVNAVLRKIASSDVDWNALPTPGLPKWLRKPLVDDFGKASVAAFEEAHAKQPPLDLTPKTGDAAALAKAVGGQLLPTGSVRLSEYGQVTQLPGYDDGDWWVQDAAAAIPARILAPKTGERVLDLCAAPGGKTMQLAASGANVTSLDSSKPRMARVSENLGRVGLSSDLITADAREWSPETLFDGVLLDAPCSATGTIRRHPDLPYAKDGSEFPELFALQADLIDRALGFLRPGGRLVFCTCSLLIDEGEEQVRDALSRHQGLTVEPEALKLHGVDPGWIGPEGGMRLRPDFWAEQGGMDGFYIASLRKAD
jgi:16S rRNA (cytosine967-C5)-methyltransferase